MTDLVQGQAVVMLGPDPDNLTDYSCWFSEFRILDNRATVTKGPSFGSPAFEDKAAAVQASVAVTFLAAPSTTSGLWWELHRAKSTTSGELYFETRGDSAAVSSSNPKRTGYMVVTAVDFGAPAFQARRQSAVYPVRGLSQPLAA